MCLVTAMSFLLYVLFFEVINSILQQNLLASMFTEGMPCPLEVHGSGLGEALFLFIIILLLLCEHGKSWSCGPKLVLLDSCERNHQLAPLSY